MSVNICKSCNKPILSITDEKEFGCNWGDYSLHPQEENHCWSCGEAVRSSKKHKLTHAICTEMTAAVSSHMLKTVVMMNSKHKMPMCHSHRFTNINSVLIKACAKVDIDWTVDLDLVTEAWNNAKDNDYNRNKV